MGSAARLVIGLVVLACLAAVSRRDLRMLGRRAALPAAVPATLVAASVVAGYVHLALTPEHWRLGAAYGLFFLASGATQLAFAALACRSDCPPALWVALAVTNTVLVAVYVLTRVVALPGAARPEPVDALGAGTALAEVGCAALGLLLAHRLARTRTVAQGTTSN